MRSGPRQTMARGAFRRPSCAVTEVTLRRLARSRPAAPNLNGPWRVAASRRGPGSPLRARRLRRRLWLPSGTQRSSSRGLYMGVAMAAGCSVLALPSEGPPMYMGGSCGGSPRSVGLPTPSVAVRSAISIGTRAPIRVFCVSCAASSTVARAAGRCTEEALAGVELLLRCGPDEFLAAVPADQLLILKVHEATPSLRLAVPLRVTRREPGNPVSLEPQQARAPQFDA
jgi:hypothetical protein